MTEQNNDAVDNGDDAAPDELSLLKERAKTLGIKHSPNIGLEALRTKVNGAVNGDKDEDEEAPAQEEAAAGQTKLSPLAAKAALRRKVQKEQLRLIRVRVTNMNPAKKEWAGEIFTIANKYLGIVKKFVPFGEATDEGFHVPYCLYRQMKDRKFQQIKTKKDPKNPAQIQVTSRWVNEFALEVLDPLTTEDLAKLSAHQAAAAGM